MSCPCCAYSIDIHILGLRCSWWHSRQANDVIGSEQSILSQNQDYKSFLRVAINPYIPILQGLDAHGDKKLTYTNQTTTVTLTTHVRRRLKTVYATVYSR